MLPVQFPQSYEMTVVQLHQQFPMAGMNVKVSFQIAGSTLPHSCEEASCRCGMAVLLVYGDDPQPATLWVRGQDSHTWVSVDESLGYRVSAEFERRLKRALQV